MHARQVDEQAASPTLTVPRVWLVLGDKKGDNGQVHSIENALDWPCEVKRIQMLEPYVYGKPRVGPTLYHIDRERSDPLQPPWPDLVITVGRRPANVALWIKKQSGNHTRVVMVGKPSGMMKAFDLIIASAENRFPPLANVLTIALPMMQVDADAVADAVRQWDERMSALPKPLIGIMIGGPTNPFSYGGSTTRKLLAAIDDVVRQGGTPYITTSRRTPQFVVDALQAALPPQARLFQWTPDSTDNPYLALLGHADGFVVTGDSISMIVEVVRLGKPLQILSLPGGVLGSIDQVRRSLARWLFARGGDGLTDQARRLLARLVYASGFIRHTRDFRAFHRSLVRQGLAVWAGQGFTPPTGQVPDDVTVVVERIKELLGTRTP